MSTDTMNKFLFDMSFDDGVKPAGPEAPPTVTLTEEELLAAREAAYQEGVAAGCAQANAGHELKTAEMMTRVAGELEKISAIAGAASQGRRETIVTAVKAIAQNMLPVYLSKYGYEEMERLVVQCLSELRDEPRLVIRVAERQADDCVRRFEGLAAQGAFPGKLIILPEPGLQENDCRIEWADGGLERTMDTLWTEIETILARSLGALKSGTAATQAAAATYEQNATGE